jgi:hypothetical protein
MACKKTVFQHVLEICIAPMWMYVDMSHVLVRQTFQFETIAKSVLF